MDSREKSSRKSNVARLVNPEYERLLKKAVEENSLSRFLDAISLIVESTIQDDSAVRYWKDLSFADEAWELSDVLLRWLATMDFEVRERHADKNIASASSVETPEVAQKKKLAKEAAECWVDAQQSFRDRVRWFETAPEMEAFRGFYGNVPLLEMLPMPGMEPLAGAARCIAEYARYLVPQIETRAMWDSLARIWVEQRWLRDFVDEELIPAVAARLQEDAAQGDRLPSTRFRSTRAWPFLTAMLAGEVDLSQPQTFPEGFEVGMIPELMLHCPQELFDVLAEIAAVEMPSFEFDDEEEPYLRIFELMTTLPLKGVSFESAAFARDLPEDAVFAVELKSISAGRGFLCVRAEQLACLVFQYCTMGPTVQDLATGKRSRIGEQDWTIGMLESRLELVDRNLRAARRQNAGRFPCDRYHASLLAYSLDQMSNHIGMTIEFDLGLLLAGDDETDGVIGYEAGVASPMLPFVAEGSDTAQVNLRSELFRQAVSGADSEGLTDLADALSGFYLVTQTVAARHCSAIDWGWIGQRLADRIDLPESDLLRGCVRLSHEFAAELGTDKWLDTRQLSRFLRDAAPVIGLQDAGQLLTRLEMVRLEEARKSLETRLGEAVLKSLSELDRKMLEEAEYAWRHAEQRREQAHHTPNFDSIVILWFKVVEKWLNRTYALVSQDSGIKEWFGPVRSGRAPEISRVIGFFSSIHLLPEDSRRHLEKQKCFLGSSKDFSSQWLNELRKLRNLAAHGGAVGAKDVRRMREMLLDAGIAMLVRALPPIIFED